MRSTRRVFTAVLSLLLTLFATNIAVRADDDQADEYDVKDRVVRISLIQGEVALKRVGNSDWERARLNFPLVEGDTIAVDRDSRLEIQIDSRNFVRVEQNSILRIVTLRDEGVALSLVGGTVSIRLVKFDRDHEYFEVDAPKTTLAVEKKGLYRIDAASDGRVRLSVRDGGRARIYSETSGFVLRDGRTAELLAEGSDAGDWEFLPAVSRDAWDYWVADRERYLAPRSHYDTQYYDNYLWGAEDLDAYGDWSYVDDYGWIWRPRTIITNNYYNWAPYRYGNWTWCPPYGWTWVADEPWGWAPYHYGRWVYHNNYWAWCPRSHYYRHRSLWRPALVAFVSVHLSFGDSYCWYPLSYHQRDPRSRYYGARDRLTPLHSNELANLRRVNPAYLRAVSTLPASDFGGNRAKLQPASDSLARRVVNAEPLRGDLPVKPTNGFANNGAGNDRDEGVRASRPARITPNVQLPERPTGAALRNPGVQLDDELRRTRILNGRDPKPAAPVENTNRGESRPTGAVARPARPARESGDRVEERDRENRNANPDLRPARPITRPAPVEEGPARRDSNEEPIERPSRVPARTHSNEEGPPVDRPSRPERNETHERTDRPERVERPAQPERTQEHERVERHDTPARPDPPERRNESPRSQPEPRHEPPPRPERQPEPPPQRYEPPPQRSEPPPQRSEPPPQRSEPPPQRSEPPPQRSEPPPQRSEPPPQRSEPPAQRSEPDRSPGRPEKPIRER